MKKILIGVLSVVVLTLVIAGFSALHVNASTTKDGSATLKSMYWICDCTKDYEDCRCVILP